MDTKQIVEAVKELAASKSLSEEDVGIALEEALQKTYLKVLGGWEDAEVYCHVDIEKGTIELGQLKTVVDEVEDDYVEIELAEAKKINKKAKVGEKIAIPAELSDFSKAIAMAVKSNLRQRLAEAERSALYTIYKDHIGEMMVGVVEKADDRNVFVNIGRTTVELTRRELIGDEYFKVGDSIKVYIQEVKSANEAVNPNTKKRGPQIEATRSSEGFLKRLFEEEIHEIYDGTVVIKAIARQAGVRSKVAVYSNNEDVDATGACIGQGGSRIQKIVGQLGNGKGKEKIDIINYSPFAPLFIMEAVRPSQALGVIVVEEDKTAEVVVPNDQIIAYNRYKANLSLASKLTGYKITYLSEEDAEGIDYITREMALKMAEEEKRLQEREEYAKKSLEEARRREEARRAAEEEARRLAEEAEEARKAAEEAAAKAASAKETKAEPLPEKPAVAPKASANPEEFPAEAINPAAAALAAVAEAKRREAEEAAKRAAMAAEQAEAPEEEPVKEEEAQTTDVKTTTTLSDLERELDETRERKTTTKGSKRPRKITEEEVKRDPIKPTAPTGMAIYTEEELAAMNEEDEADIDLYDDEEESDIDEEYNEYDRYYDDEN